MSRLTPSDIEKSGRPYFAGVSHLELEETAWRLREAALAFDLDGNLVNSSRPPYVGTPRSRQWRKKPIVPDGSGNEAASSPEGAKPIVPGAGWRAIAMTPARLIPAATLACASDSQGGRNGLVACLRTRENRSSRLENGDGLL